jgi:hypothetical protein
MLAAARSGTIDRPQVLEAIMCEMSRVTTLDPAAQFELERRRSVLIHRYLRTALEILAETSASGPALSVAVEWHVGPIDLGDGVRLKP